MNNNSKAIKIIEKYSSSLTHIENSEGWYKYSFAVKELLKNKHLLDNSEIKILLSYSEE
jgi:hypothetical protein